LTRSRDGFVVYTVIDDGLKRSSGALAAVIFTGRFLHAWRTGVTVRGCLLIIWERKEVDMSVRLAIATALLGASVLFAADSAVLSAGCAATKTDSTGRTCRLMAEGVDFCRYWNDSTHCTGPILP